MDKDLAVIKERWRRSLLPPSERDRRAILDAARPPARTLRPDETWPDVPYDDKNATHWGPGEHATRLNLIARAYAVSPEGNEKESLKNAAVRALHWWAAHDPQCPNWWWNEIGIGQLLSETILFLDNAAPPEPVAYAVDVLLARSLRPAAGANLVWLRENLLARSVLGSLPDAAARAFGDIYAELKIVPLGQEGIQADRTLHQHGAQFYSGGYGFFFGNDAARFTYLAWGTRFQIPPGKMAILSEYLLDGQQWMIRGDTFDYSAIGREITREGKVAVPRSWVIGPISPPGVAYGLPHATELLASLPGVPRREEYKTMAARLWAGNTPRPPKEVTGNRHFWCSDYMAHRRDGFLFSIRMTSSRLQNTEIVNGEGTRSHHLADGATFLYRTGSDYRDIFPLWDWRKIPGTTAEQGSPTLSDMGKIARHGQTDFVGGVSDNTIGLAAFDFVRDALQARKAYACFGDVIVCLGAGIASTGSLPVTTTLDQRWAAATGGSFTSGPGWVSHDQITYLFPTGYPMGTPSIEKRTGRWSDLGAGSPRPVSGDIFTLVLDHGVRPDADRSRYAYVILPSAAEGEKARTAAQNQIKIVTNTLQAQAVYHAGSNALLVAFYEPGKVSTGTGPSDWVVSASEACAVSLRSLPNHKVSVAVSNPRSHALQVIVQINRRLVADADENGSATSRLVFVLPGGQDGGRSVVQTYRVAS